MSRTLQVAAACLGFLSIAGVSHADCVRHFYNQSHDDWSLAFHNLAGTCSVAGAIEVEQCTIPAGKTALLHITPANGKHANRYLWIGTAGNATGRGYDHAYNLDDTKECRIDHSGGTGRATLNAPADGDIATVD
jgi:hypothetical protein